MNLSKFKNFSLQFTLKKMKTSQPQAVRKLLPKFTKHMYEGIIAMHENIKVPIAKKDNPIKNGQKM